MIFRFAEINEARLAGENYLLKVVIGDEVREDIPFVTAAGFAYHPKKGDTVLLLQDQDGQYIALKIEHANAPALQEKEVALYLDAENFIKLSTNKRLSLRANGKDFFTFLSDFLDRLKTHTTPTIFGEMPPGVASQTQIELLKLELKDFMEPTNVS